MKQFNTYDTKHAFDVLIIINLLVIFVGYIKIFSIYFTWFNLEICNYEGLQHYDIKTWSKFIFHEYICY